jgi:hypothetical protein
VLHSTRRFACPRASIGRFGPVASIRWPEPIAGARHIAPEAGQTAPMPVASLRIRPGSPAAGGRIPGPVAAA